MSKLVYKLKVQKICGGKMCSRTRTFGAEVQKSNIRITRWHNKYKILNCIERHNFCLSDLLTKSNRTTLQSYKVEERTFGTPCKPYGAKLSMTVTTKFLLNEWYTLQCLRF